MQRLRSSIRYQQMRMIHIAWTRIRRHLDYRLGHGPGKYPRRPLSRGPPALRVERLRSKVAASLDPGGSAPASLVTEPAPRSSTRGGRRQSLGSFPPATDGRNDTMPFGHTGSQAMTSERRVVKSEDGLAYRFRRVVLIELPAWQVLILAAVIGVI